MARTPEHRDFDVARFADSVLAVIKARHLTHEEAASQCGVYTALFSKMRRSGTAPSVGAFLNICAWADLNPMDFRATERQAPKVGGSAHFAGLLR